MPIAFALGGRDPIVPPQSALRLAGVLKKLNPNVLLIFREAAEHETDYNDGKAVLDFVIDKATRASTDPSPSKKKS
jgi:predicted esterase